MWCKSNLPGLFLHLYSCVCHFVCFVSTWQLSLCIGWAARMMLSDSCSFFFSPLVSMATVSSDWGQRSNWPIERKLHFSEWFPQSCYWNRALALWWIHLVIHSLEGKRGKYKHDIRGLPSSNKKATKQANIHTAWQSFKCDAHLHAFALYYVLNSKGHILNVSTKSSTQGALPNTNTDFPPNKPFSSRSLVCLNQGSLNPSARVQVLTLTTVLLFLSPPPRVLWDQFSVRPTTEGKQR